MRILFITQWFDPEPTFKGLAFARELTRLGHEVQVLTGFPNYPGGKIYPGFRIRLLQRERIDGIDVIRVPLYPSHSRSRLGRIANYFSFALAACLIGPLAVRLKSQHGRGSDYLVGDGFTAADVYAATAIGLFKPLPQAVCEMVPATRAAFEALDEPTAAALDPVLLAHRDMMYRRHLATPLRL